MHNTLNRLWSATKDVFGFILSPLKRFKRTKTTNLADELRLRAKLKETLRLAEKEGKALARQKPEQKKSTGFLSEGNRKTLERFDSALDGMFKPSISPVRATKTPKRYSTSHNDMFTSTMDIKQQKKGVRKEKANMFGPTKGYWE